VHVRPIKSIKETTGTVCEAKNINLSGWSSWEHCSNEVHCKKMCVKKRETFMYPIVL
jgi:hypothetical protein